MTPQAYALTSDWVAVRELPAPPDSAVILQVDNPNKRPGTVIQGIVEQTGPGKRTKQGEILPMDVTTGDRVWYEIEAGRARLPWDYDVRIMRQGDIAAVETP
jgi:co-chaperonin GroES (HSP10)